MSIKTVIMLVPDQPFPLPGGCVPCIYHYRDLEYTECRAPYRLGLECCTKAGHYRRVVASTESRNKREGHYWCKSQGQHLRYPKASRYKYGKAKSICPAIMYNPEQGND